MRSIFSLSLFALLPFLLHAQGPDLIGYWQNWNDANAPYIALDQIDPRYSIVEVAFAEPQAGTTFDMSLTPSGTDIATLAAQVNALQAQGKKVLISIGGANATVQLNSDVQRDLFVSSMLSIISDYGFDGIDIDLEGASVSITGGTIASPVDATIIRLIDAINSIADQFETTYGTPMMLTMAPETAYVQGGMSAFGGIWGAYLPIIDALRERITVLQVQLYNSGSMYGIDGNTYTQGSADFILSQTEALLQGFNTSGGHFDALPPENVAIGLPACTQAAGGGYVTPAVLASAVHYLRGEGPQPGIYTRTSTYPSLRGLMTWSINWDAVNTCGPSYEFAQSFEDLFDPSTSVSAAAPVAACIAFPDPSHGELTLRTSSAIRSCTIIDATGRSMKEVDVDPPSDQLTIATVPPGLHTALLTFVNGRSTTVRFVVE